MSKEDPKKVEEDDKKTEVAGDSGDPVVDGLWELFDRRIRGVE